MRESRTSGSVGTPERVIARGDPAHPQVLLGNRLTESGNTQLKHKVNIVHTSKSVRLVCRISSYGYQKSFVCPPRNLLLVSLPQFAQTFVLADIK
jgi:hypothetical protein